MVMVTWAVHVCCCKEVMGCWCSCRSLASMWGEDLVLLRAMCCCATTADYGLIPSEGRGEHSIEASGPQLQQDYITVYSVSLTSGVVRAFYRYAICMQGVVLCCKLFETALCLLSNLFPFTGVCLQWAQAHSKCVSLSFWSKYRESHQCSRAEGPKQPSWFSGEHYNAAGTKNFWFSTMGNLVFPHVRR